LPRTVEIDKAVDDDPRAQYFTQAANGLFIRMALLTLLWDRD
jgi:aspartate carbamoyltransferase catalytic subunit